jgi:hypothetical protein
VNVELISRKDESLRLADLSVKASKLIFIFILLTLAMYSL